MTDEKRLAEIEARCKAATEGPWTTEKPKRTDHTGFVPGVVVAATAPGSGIYANPPGGSFPSADRQFIAHARADVPWLLAQVRAAHAAGLQEAAEIVAETVVTFDRNDTPSCVVDTTRQQLAAAILAQKDQAS